MWLVLKCIVVRRLPGSQVLWELSVIIQAAAWFPFITRRASAASCSMADCPSVQVLCVCVCVCSRVRDKVHSVCVCVCMHRGLWYGGEGAVREKERGGGGGGGAECACYGKKRSGLSRISESESLRRSTQITGVIRRAEFALIIEILQFWMNWQMQSGRCCCPGGSTPQQFYRRRSFEVDQFCMGELQSICHCSLCNCLWCC